MEAGFREGYIFVIRTEDGGHVTNEVFKIEHNNVGSAHFLTQSSAMILTDYGKVIQAWRLFTNLREN